MPIVKDMNPRRQQFLADTADVFKTWVYENNRRVVPSSAAITVYKPGSTEKLVDAQAMTIGSDGAMIYNLTAAHNDVADENYKAVVSYVHGGTTCYATLFYDVVNSRLVKVITDEDIVDELPQLKDNGWRFHGTAGSGSTTTIVDAGLKRYDDDYFTGGLARSFDNDETREVTGFASSTGTVTTTAFSSAITSGGKYMLTRSFSREIRRAFEKMEETLGRMDKRAHLILDPGDMREVHILWSVAEVCKGLLTDEKSIWWGLWKDYEKKGAEALEGINFKYDESADGVITGNEENVTVNKIRAGRG
ncbi:MAG: hypothetical protein HY890_05625 [Deltaproteobacteria bacterium]|nr:hypothetical protein [Deltaproteobacteria bacterium]